MLDIKFLRQNPDVVKENIKRTAVCKCPAAAICWGTTI